MKNIVILLIGCTFWSCQSQLHNHYCKNFLKEPVRYELKIDTTCDKFRFLAIGGLMQDTLKGTYKLNKSTLILTPEHGEMSQVSKEVSNDLLLKIVDKETGVPIPLVNVKVYEDTGLFTSDTNGEITIKNVQDQIDVEISDVLYETMRVSFKEPGNWVVSLVKKNNWNQDLLVWKLCKNSIKAKGLKLEHCKNNYPLAPTLMNE